MAPQCKVCYTFYRKQDLLLQRYGIDKVTYMLMLKSQNGVCAICNKSETVKDCNNNIRPLSVDHNHLTGKIRGLLCYYCNTMVAYIENSPQLVEIITKYLKETK